MTPLLVFTTTKGLSGDVVEQIRMQTRKPPLVVLCYDDVVSQSLIEHDYDKLNGLNVTARSACFPDRSTSIMMQTQELASEFASFAVLEDGLVVSNHWYETICRLLFGLEGHDRAAAVGGSLKVKLWYQYDAVFVPSLDNKGWGSWSAKWLTVCEEWRDQCKTGLEYWVPLVSRSFRRHLWYQVVPLNDKPEIFPPVAFDLRVVHHLL